MLGVCSTGGGGGGWLLGLGLDARGCSEGDWGKLPFLPGWRWGYPGLSGVYSMLPLLIELCAFFFLTYDITTLTKMTKRGISLELEMTSAPMLQAFGENNYIEQQ